MTFLFVLFAVLGVLLLLAGFAGCVLPILPGPPVSFGAILLIWGARSWEAVTFGSTTVIVLGAAAVLVSIVDYITPALGAKRYGASRAGVWGSVLGMIAGMIWFPPFGLIAGAFVGALVGEALAGKQGSEAARAAWGVFMGTVVGILLKLAVSGVIAFYFFRELLSSAA